MRKAFKVIGIIVVLIIVVVGSFALFVNFRSMPVYKPGNITVKVESSPERIARGKKLASMLCKSCHYNEQTGKFTGRLISEAPQFGEIYSANITNDPVAGIRNLTDGQLIYFIRTGIKPDGEYVPPYMPKLVHIADEELYSIIAYLRSGDPYVQPDNTRAPKTVQSFLTKFLVTIKAMGPFDYPKESISLPDTTNQVAWGKYIALYEYECYSCHSKDFAKNDYEVPEKSSGFFGGGNKMKQMDGTDISTLNLTPDKETGIGNWSEDDFIKAVKTGIVPNGLAALRYPMIPYIGLTDSELKAIFAYIKTVPPITNNVERKFAD
ncbi:MAG: cytochrome c [Ginsengibacter sp.]